MILIDFSSIVHRMIHATVARNNLTLQDGKYITSEYVGIVMFHIFQELLNVKAQYEREFGDVVICLDNSSDGLWRRDVYPGYKASRKQAREESAINFREVFAEVDNLVEAIRSYAPWKVVEVPRAEADDVIMVLAEHFGKTQPILIYSPDKDFIQCQRTSSNVKQYSPKTQKWLIPENKHDNMDHWLVEHICLGDAIDGVPKIVDQTEFSEEFLKYLKEKGYEFNTPWDFANSELSLQEKREILATFNSLNESAGTAPKVYRPMKFGPSTLNKTLEKFGSVEAWLDSNPMLRKNYERNYTLVMQEGIPEDIRGIILTNYEKASVDYKPRELESFLESRRLSGIVMMLPSHFKINRALTAEDFGW